MDKRLLWVLAGAAALLLATNGENIVTDIKNLVNRRGIRNNNPGNIRYNPTNAWVGQTGKDADGFAVFDTPLHGLRALAKLALNKINAGGNTVERLISAWAPPSENDTASYIASVCKALGVSAGDVIGPASLPGIVAAIVAHENGGNPYPVDMIRQAISAI